MNTNSSDSQPDALADFDSHEVHSPMATTALRGLLRAAAAPARDEELRGEAVALAAFRNVHRPVAESRSPLVRSTVFMNRMTRLLTVKVAAVAIATTGMGGVALAANAGTLPVPADTPVVGSEAKTAKKAKKEKKHWNGLCTSVMQGNADNASGKAAERGALAALVAKAGGPSGVAAFCAPILALPLPEVAPIVDPVVATLEPVVEPVVPTPVVEPVVPAPVVETPGKSANAGKENAPGQTKPEGQPATGKGKVAAPGRHEPADDQGGADNGKAEDSGKATAPGQSKAEGRPAVGKGSDNRQGPKQDAPTAS